MVPGIVQPIMQPFNTTPLRGQNSILIPFVFLFGSSLGFFKTIRVNGQDRELRWAIPAAMGVFFLAYIIIYR